MAPHFTKKQLLSTAKSAVTGLKLISRNAFLLVRNTALNVTGVHAAYAHKTAAYEAMMSISNSDTRKAYAEAIDEYMAVRAKCIKKLKRDLNEMLTEEDFENRPFTDVEVDGYIGDSLKSANRSRVVQLRSPGRKAKAAKQSKSPKVSKGFRSAKPLHRQPSTPSVSSSAGVLGRASSFRSTAGSIAASSVRNGVTAAASQSSSVIVQTQASTAAKIVANMRVTVSTSDGKLLKGMVMFAGKTRSQVMIEDAEEDWFANTMLTPEQ